MVTVEAPPLWCPQPETSVGLDWAQQHRWHIHLNTSVIQGVTGIVPLDGAIVKELGFVNYVSDTQHGTCPGAAGTYGPYLPPSTTLLWNSKSLWGAEAQQEGQGSHRACGSCR